MFFTIEGIDGSGKTTSAKKLYDFLVSQNKKALLTSEPRCNGRISWANSILDIVLNKDIRPETQLMLINSVRKEHIETIIKPALNDGYIVICDRFIDSTICYQGYAMGIDTDYIKNIHKIIQQNFMPDITFFMDISPEVALERMKKRGNMNAFDSKPLDFMYRIYNGFISEAAKDSKRIVTVKDNQNICDIFNTLVK